MNTLTWQKFQKMLDNICSSKLRQAFRISDQILFFYFNRKSGEKLPGVH